MFWEPGVYACYLLSAPLLFIDDLKSFVKLNRYKVIVLMVALITTFSTTGYLVASLFLFSYFRKINRLIGPIIAILVFTNIFSSDTVSMKFERDLSTIENLSLGKTYFYDGYNSANRLGSIFFLMNIILDHPFIGNGLNPEALFANNRYLLLEDNLGIGNGFFSYIASMGIIGLFIYYGAIWRYWKNKKIDKLLSLLIITLLLQGEPLLMYPLFIGLPFLRNKIV